MLRYWAKFDTVPSLSGKAGVNGIDQSVVLKAELE
jgi:hypothetical protein